MPLGSQSNTGHRPKDHRFLVLYFGCAMHSICSRCTALSARTVQQSLDASITEEPRNCEAPKNCSQEKCADEWKQGRDPTLAMQASYQAGASSSARAPPRRSSSTPARVQAGGGDDPGGDPDDGDDEGDESEDRPPPWGRFDLGTALQLLPSPGQVRRALRKLRIISCERKLQGTHYWQPRVLNATYYALWRR